MMDALVLYRLVLQPVYFVSLASLDDSPDLRHASLHVFRIPF
jgi:hypothetical protein